MPEKKPGAGWRSATDGYRYKQAEVADALRRGAGITSAAAVILGCTPKTVRNYLDRYPKLRAGVEEIIEINLDQAEAKLLNAINDGAEWAVRFYLETRGRSRGYSHRTEIAGVPGQPLVVVDASARKWLVDQLDQMDERLRIAPPVIDDETVH